MKTEEDYIPKEKADEIKRKAKIVDILTDGLGVVLHRDGKDLTGLCPFHEDKRLGSFKVSVSKNICKCFACQNEALTPVNALMIGKGMSYTEALRWMAKKYGVYIDDKPTPNVAPATPREEPKELPVITWSQEDTCDRYMQNAVGNPLLMYLMNEAQMPRSDREQLMQMVELYKVGTSRKGETEGWTLWWQIDATGRVRTGKLMKYLPNGHRDHNGYNFDFTHSKMLKAGMWCDDDYRYETCLFGLHLVDQYPDAEICLVESEKSALICSAFTDPSKKLWMATTGLSFLNARMLKPLIDRKRHIVLYPDYDGYDQWKKQADRIGYDRITISQKVREAWEPGDGPKADIADIMLRRAAKQQESEVDILQRRLGLQHISEPLRQFINDLKIKAE